MFLFVPAVQEILNAQSVAETLGLQRGLGSQAECPRPHWLSLISGRSPTVEQIPQTGHWDLRARQLYVFSSSRFEGSGAFESSVCGQGCGQVRV